MNEISCWLKPLGYKLEYKEGMSCPLSISWKDELNG